MNPTIRGPWEPEAFALIRAAYWARTIWLAKLEGRIQRTDAGLEFLMRVKRIGRSRRPVTHG